MWFFAPPSACTRLPCPVPSRRCTSRSASSRRTRPRRRPGASSSASTASLSPWTTLNTPSGRPASRHSSAIRAARDGSFSDGLSTTVLPARDRDRDDPHRHHHREVERRDARDDAQRLPDRVDVHPGRHVLGEPALQQVRDAARELDHLQPARAPRRRASASTLPCSAVMNAASSSWRGVDQLAEREQHLRALAERCLRPLPERLARPTGRPRRRSRPRPATSPPAARRWPDSIPRRSRDSAPGAAGGRAMPSIQCSDRPHVHYGLALHPGSSSGRQSPSGASARAPATFTMPASPTRRPPRAPQRSGLSILKRDEDLT